MSMCGEIENTIVAIDRLRVKLSNTNLSEQQRKQIECDLAYEVKRLEDLQKITTKDYA
jgi:hypothetical protein